MSLIKQQPPETDIYYKTISLKFILFSVYLISGYHTCQHYELMKEFGFRGSQARKEK